MFPDADPKMIAGLFDEPLPEQPGVAGGCAGGAGGEAASLLHACGASGIHGADYAVAESGGGDWGLYLLGAESESRRVFDRAVGGGDGAADRAVADRYGRIWRRRQAGT